MINSQKKRGVISYDKMVEDPRFEELLLAFNQKYPRGFNDYLQDLVKYPKPDGTFFYAVTIDIETAIYLVKIDVKTDDAEDLERWLDEQGEEGEGGDEGGNIPEGNGSADEYHGSEADAAEAAE
ncbi:MAG: hypothetical protein HUJ95_01125 [Bacteroidales bacterium]|nr:hypothetical protein [Bacteroidales bacterium]